MIVNSVKEMQVGEFVQKCFVWKCKEVSCYLQGNEPYSPWSYSTEHEIREVKKGDQEIDTFRCAPAAVVLCA
jgi:hypothetical protein